MLAGGRALHVRHCHMLLGENKSSSEEEQVLGAGMLCSLLLPGHFAFASLDRREEPAVMVVKPPPTSLSDGWREWQSPGSRA